jgi:hypothetical protein
MVSQNEGQLCGEIVQQLKLLERVDLIAQAERQRYRGSREERSGKLKSTVKTSCEGVKITCPWVLQFCFPSTESRVLLAKLSWSYDSSSVITFRLKPDSGNALVSMSMLHIGFVSPAGFHGIGLENRNELRRSIGISQRRTQDGSSFPVTWISTPAFSKFTSAASIESRYT